jgi:hypothetical protein
MRVGFHFTCRNVSLVTVLPKVIKKKDHNKYFVCNFPLFSFIYRPRPRWCSLNWCLLPGSLNFILNFPLIDFFVTLQHRLFSKVCQFFMLFSIKRNSVMTHFFVFFLLLVLTTRLPTAHRCSLLSKFADTFYLQIDISLSVTCRSLLNWASDSNYLKPLCNFFWGDVGMKMVNFSGDYCH